MLIPEQCRAARALLGWTQEELAARSGVACSTVRGFEKGHHAPIRSNLAALRAAFEAAGVILIAADEQGPGVRLREPIRRDAAE